MENYLRRAMERVGGGLLAGSFAGFIVTGIGGRIVMRIIAVVDPNTDIEFTGRTIFLLIAGGTLGAVSGATGGLLYLAVRRFLPGVWIWKGLAFGVIWLLITGGIFFSIGQAEEFSDFDPPLLGISLFAALFIIYGLIVAAIVERFNMYSSSPSDRWVTTVTGYVALVIVSVGGLFLNITAISNILEAAE